MHNQNIPDPSSIMQMATAYWQSTTLFTALETGIFDRLADGEKTAVQLAQECGCSERGVLALAEACVGAGLIERFVHGDEPSYANTPATNFYLVSSSPASLKNAISWSSAQYPHWGRLTNAVRDGQPVSKPEVHLGEDTEQTRRFVQGMYARAMSVARGVVRFLPIGGVKHLLDVGGGSGAYAILLAQNSPELKVTVLDLPGILAVSEEIIKDSGKTAQIELLAGDALTTDFGEATYDAVLFSGVLHQMSPSTIREQLAKAYRALRSEGMIYIIDIIKSGHPTQDAFPSLFSLQMLLTSEQGAVFSTEDMKVWLETAGYQDIHSQPIPPPLPYWVITARCGAKEK